MQKVFAKKLKNDTFSFYDDDIYHLLKVLRFKLNHELIVNWDGLQYLTKITSLEPLRATIQKPLEIDTNLNKKISLYQAVIKPKNFEWIISKSAEMQIWQLYPVLFQRTNLQNLVPYERMQTIAKTASSQCAASFILNVNEKISFTQMLKHLSSYDLVVVPYENDNLMHPLYEIRSKILQAEKIAIIIGPEGGFANDEIMDLQKLSNVILVSLTKTILRSDTAAFYSIANIVNIALEGENNG